MKTTLVSMFLCLIAVSGLSAQSTLNQQISGQVLDATGSAHPNAAITVVDQGTNLTRSTKTNQAGNYVIADLPTGKYRVTCEAPGFKKEVIADNQLNTDFSIEVNFKLQVGSQADTVTIEADVAQVELTNGEVGYTVTGEQAAELQLNGRNFPNCCTAARSFNHIYRRLRLIRRLRS